MISSLIPRLPCTVHFKYNTIYYGEICLVRKHTFGPNAPPLLASREEHTNLDGRTELCITPEHVTGTELWSGEREPTGGRTG